MQVSRHLWPFLYICINYIESWTYNECSNDCRTSLLYEKIVKSLSVSVFFCLLLLFLFICHPSLQIKLLCMEMELEMMDQQYVCVVREGTCSFGDDGQGFSFRVHRQNAGHYHAHPSLCL